MKQGQSMVKPFQMIFIPRLSTILNILVAVFTFINLSQAVRNRERHHYSQQNKLFLNEFSVHINGNHRLATDIAQKHGFINKGQVRMLYFLKSNILFSRAISYTYASQ